MLGDTVVIGDSGATVLTPSKKKIRSVSIFLKVSDVKSTDRDGKGDSARGQF